MKSMASISTCFNLPQNSRFLSSSISLRPPNHFPRTLLPPRFPLKLRLPHARVPIVRASIEVASAIRPGGAVESDKLPSDVRKRAMDAVDASGRRVTIGDVASRAGLKLNEAQMALQALAADTDGFLEVSDEGDVLYVFPKDFRTKLAAKSFRMKIEPWLDKAKATGEYIVRVSFGTALVASIVIVFTAIIAIISSKSDDDNRDRRGRSRGRSFDSGFNFYLSPTDLFWYWDPYYYKRRRVQADNDKKLNFIESVFSFVFGDGDPNQGIEEERWKMIGQYITSKGGVVAAEELAPYLDITNLQDRNDESYILPVLIRFDGQPEIDEEGNILYRFPSLQRTAASSQRSGRKEYVWSNWVSGVENFFKERKWEFSKTGSSERAMVIGLGGLNLFGVVVLGAMLKEANPIGYIKFVASIFPLLQVYAGSFFAIPLIRWFILRQRNANIEKRNLARVGAAKALERPDISLRRKLLSARDMAQRTVIGQDRIVYSTEKDLADQDYDAREWERKFKEIE